ncbi:MAG TPA: hypothetical protein DCW83_09935 [Saprospirales bacterium]|nr:hypothetical protein [Saprospirales bacterium]
MAITFTKNETFDGTRVHTMPDPDNEGETITETTSGIRDIEVTFTSDDPAITHTRMVNVCFEADGTTYDSDATDARIAEVGAGVEHKIAVGVIS